MFGLLRTLAALADNQCYLRTNVGADFQAAQMGSTTPGTNGANYIALTANATGPAAGDTTLTAEIVTSGGGLIRKQAAYAHTAGTTSYTLTATFIGNGSDAYPVTPAKIGVFNLAAAGSLVFETLIPSPPTLAASGDAITITETVSL